MRRYRLSLAAKNDLRSVTRYTVEGWGKEQNDRYMSLLDECFDKIGNRELVARHFHRGFPDLLVVHCEHHQIFYLRTPPDEIVPIIAVLHENMDLLVRVKNRLQQS